MELLLKNGHVVDSANGFEGDVDILIRDGEIREVGSGISARTVSTSGFPTTDIFAPAAS